MGFCRFEEEDGIFILTLDGGDGGHHYFTEESLTEIKDTLATIRSRANPSSKGLVTTSARGSFCDGIDYKSAPQVEKLVHGMAEVVHELFNMPFPTVAAVRGDVKTSLALALVLAHDDSAVWKDAAFETKEVRDGRAVPPYLGALLRDKATYAEMSSALVLRSETMSGDTYKWWYGTDWKCGSRLEVVGATISIITGSFGNIRDGDAYITTRKSFFPESWKAVSKFLE